VTERRADIEEGKPRIVAIIQARCGSSRMPGKVLRPLQGVPLLAWSVRRLCLADCLDFVGVATSDQREDDAVSELCNELACPCFRGSENDVMERFLQAGEHWQADFMVRVTGDCPLISPITVNGVVDLLIGQNLDYAGCVHVRSFPRGMDVEAMKLVALQRVASLENFERHREHVTPYFYEHPEIFRIAAYRAEGAYRRPDVRLCLDTPEDFDVLDYILGELDTTEPEEVDLLDVIAFVDGHPEILETMREAEGRHEAKNTQEQIYHDLQGPE
jgi:spore coat polysaccharide biosynthesis protein SpsF